MTVHVKLYGERAERFEAIKAALGEEWGFEPSNPEVLGVLMAGFAAAGRNRTADR